MTATSIEKIAFIGLGHMGTPMAEALTSAGFHLTVYNRTRQVAQAFANRHPGSEAMESPAAAAFGADAVITMLSDAQALCVVYTQTDGVLTTLKPDTVAVDMGTTGPIGTAAVRELLNGVGGTLVDAPVLGSPAAAASKTLTIMAGGPRSTVERLRPVFNALGDRVYHMGDEGAGAAMKLAVNAVIFGVTEAISEALVLAERAGIARAAAYEIFSTGAVGCPEVQDRTPNYLQPESTPPSFALMLAGKDMRLITEFADSLATPMPQARLNRHIMERAIEAGLGSRDMAELSTYLRSSRHANVTGGPSEDMNADQSKSG